MQWKSCLYMLILMGCHYYVCVGAKAFDAIQTRISDTYEDVCTLNGDIAVFHISDIHGDYRQFHRLMRKLDLINDDATEWMGGTATLVFTGDYVDRGLESAKILRTLETLKAKASAKNGRIVTLKGNHEDMILRNDFRYMDARDAVEFCDPACATEESAHAFLASGGGQLGDFIRNMPIFEVIDFGPKKALFVHGGILLKMLGSQCETFPFYCRFTPAWQTPAACDFVQCAKTSLKLNNDQAVSMRPLWNREVAKGEATDEEVLKTLEAFGVDYMVLGHSIAKEAGTRYDGKVVLTDFAMSRGIWAEPLRGTYDTFHDKFRGRCTPHVTALVFYADGRIERVREKNAELPERGDEQMMPEEMETVALEGHRGEPPNNKVLPCKN
eukprot:TRINITY_DN55650_c0_g1_i1.p1 TRINITY_DN55650_c0_g1~~TRINITY_DN55650_c0_g1_i1.p1  ORF type:complete len:384 (-),score=30.50 TRINITY_DN55650_c0_g1_i1:127-1278(-)